MKDENPIPSLDDPWSDPGGCPFGPPGIFILYNDITNPVG
jgi:hypothetical protein